MALDSSKLANLILYISGHSSVKTLGVTKLWKLIYFVDATALRDLGESVTGSEFIKYEHGPVPSRGEKILKQLRKNSKVTTENIIHHGHILTNVAPSVKADLSVFSKAELEIISTICNRYGAQTAQKLSELSHQEPSWRLAKYLKKLDERFIFYGPREDSIGL
jgi:uncharacterized phage-associated protein